MNRRAALALAANALAGGCAPRRVAQLVERVHGCVDAPVPDAGGVHVLRGAFSSRSAAAPVRYAIVVPDGPATNDVGYVLPGRGSDADSALGLGLDGFLAGHLRAGGHRFALAIIDAGESYFHPRTGGEDRLATLTSEFPAVVRHALGARTLREALMGFSMGGYGAILAAERAPARYHAVAVAGPAIFPSYDDERRSVGDAFDSAADYARFDVTAHAVALRGKPVFVAVGKRDPFLPGVRRFAAACGTVKLVVAAGCHDDGFWHASMPAMLAFVGRSLSAAHPRAPSRSGGKQA